MKTIRVVAAVICDSMQEKRKIYATARGYVSMDCFWCEVVSGELVLKEAEAAR
jgi:8-oxo-dGTP diphosphatase